MSMYVGEGSVVQIFAVLLITTVTLMTEHRHSGSDVFPRIEIILTLLILLSN